jgi:hypothetical protein
MKSWVLHQHLEFNIWRNDRITKMTNSKKSRIGEMIKEGKIHPFTDRI